MDAKFRQMPWIVQKGMNLMNLPNCWVTTPLGVFVPRSRWKNPDWRILWARIVRHEEKHWERMQSFPSGKWAWTWKMLTDREFAYREEVEAFKTELDSLPMPWGAYLIVDTLITDYGFDFKTREEIFKDLTDGY